MAYVAWAVIIGWALILLLIIALVIRIDRSKRREERNQAKSRK